MKKILYGVLLLNVLYACSPRTGGALKNEGPADQTPIAATLDLVNINDDKVWVEIDPGMFSMDTVLFRLPKVVQGTYAESDFGSFAEGLIAYDYKGEEIPATQLDENSWSIADATELDRIGYYVNDTFDIEATDTPTPFSPSGTNIDSDVFVLNLHGFVGYFEDMEDSEYSISITAPAEYEKSSALQLISSTTTDEGQTVTDTYFAERYFDVTDNPMMYGELDIEEFQVGDIQIVLSVYSPNTVHSASSIKETVYTMMEAQKAYLGELNSTPRYDIFLYLAANEPGAPEGFGALEHHTSTVVVLPEWYQKPQLDQAMIDVVSHEFFHIVTPLTVHSEDVHYFDYNAPTFSKHLWMYEGVTEYFASHFQVYEDLQPRQEFYDKISGKIQTSMNMDDEMSFTVMSENVLEEPYASNYYNVYMKGALIGMCIDILMREESNGERSMLSLMKELSEKYGMEKPFEDDAIIDEITAMTYPSVGDFLNTHVAGTTPIDYSVYFDKVGLEIVEEEVATSFFFRGQVPFIDADPQTGEIFFRNTTLNSSLTELGIIPGDILKSVNGTEYSLSNIQTVLPASFQWTPDTELTVVIDRDGEELELTGVVGSPTVPQEKLVEKEDATEEQIQLRNFWLEK